MTDSGSLSSGSLSVASAPPVKLRRPRAIKYPRRAPSVVAPTREIVYVTADKTTCARCDCYPRDSPFVKPPKLDPCQHSPSSLYELTADVVDKLPLPDAVKWSTEDVAEWMCHDVGLPRYRECIEDNFIDGMRLLMLEDPSKPPQINIRDFEHIKLITSMVRALYGTDFIRFTRSIGLPPRRPGVHCTWFKSRTGPSWGIRQNWTRSDILRWMKILDPAPVHRDHWDMVWYLKPNFPATKFGHIEERKHFPDQKIPNYVKTGDKNYEYTIPRKFRLLDLPEEQQLIWMEHRQEENKEKEKKPRRRERKTKKETTLIPKPVDASGLTGKEFILARRLMPKRKFFG